jgi:hypothetical protein
MSTTEYFALDSMHVAWDAKRRVFQWSAVSPCDLKSEWGPPYCDFLARHTADSAPYCVLADAHNVGKIAPEFRRVLTDFYRKELGRVRVAVYNANTLIRVMLYFMSISAGMEGRAFGTRKEALAWLGISETEESP